MNRPLPIQIGTGAVVLALAAACASGNQAGTGGGSTTAQTVAESKLCAAGSRPLFDGRTQAGWRVYQGTGPSAGWSVVDGALTKTRATDDIITEQKFGDFELTLDWRVSRGGNAGLFYRATEEYNKVYWSATEYQLLDDAIHRDGRDPLTSAGAAYGLYPAAAGIAKPAGEWNSTRVVARGPHVEHWLNGTKLLEYELWSPDWEAKVKASKFAPYPNYGRARQGHIAIQGDHGGELALRNICIREMNP